MSGQPGDALGVLNLLRKRGETVAFAESLTGGLLASALIDFSGSSAAVLGGAIAYNNLIKTDLLGVQPKLLERGGAVQGEVAEQMAVGALNLFGSTWALATTGVAGPEASPDGPAGLAFVAVRNVSGTGETVELRLTGNRNQVREQVVRRSLQLFYRWLEG